MKTGGSSSTVYSRSRRPRAQLASTRIVTNGSVTERFEVTLIAARPSRLRWTEKVNEVR
jgi:hypothetical protein